MPNRTPLPLCHLARLVALFASAAMACTPVHAADPPPPYTLQHYTGTVDGRLAFQMVLYPQGPDGQRCEGGYVYQGQRLPVPLVGVCSAAQLALQELPPRDAHHTGAPPHRIDAQGQPAAGGQGAGGYQGQWQSGDGRRTLRFEARPVPPDQRALLQQVVGDHPLGAISGFFGANTMSDISRWDGRWQAGSSGISGGTRQGQAVALRRSDLALLDSLMLRVTPALDVELRARGRAEARFAFSDAPAFHVTRISREEGDILGIYHGEHSHWVGKRLRIATTDALNVLPWLPFQNLSLDADVPIAVVLELDPMSLSFELRLLSGRCCDQVSLQFADRR